ncbi:MAG: NAD(P)-dependent oxidoreductase [Solirubrobacterales bacterium]|nr:NAD(P)-dependent oxidoreductase [Solirubrobacterales bacterium]
MVDNIVDNSPQDNSPRDNSPRDNSPQDSSPHDRGRRLRIAVIGIGEAGGAIAADLATRPLDVSCWDPAVGEPPPGARAAGDARDAAAGADAILSVNSASAALRVAREVAPALEPGQLYADLNTSAPALKVELAALVRPTGALFADVALMAPVLGNRLRTPCLVSGPGAERFLALFGPLGMPAQITGTEPGVAAARKLLRSVFMKGIAAAAIESLAAASASGCEDWLHDEIAQVLDQADPALLDRLITGSRRHAQRREQEMQAAQEMLSELGVRPRVSRAAAGWLAQLQSEVVRGS